MDGGSGMSFTPVKFLDDYQEVACDFLLGGKFRCLFDEPGVGKTGPSIMAGWKTALENGQGAPVLVTAPAYLLRNWEKEIHDFVPAATVVRADGAGYKARWEAFQSDVDFVLTSYNNWSAKSAGGYIYPELTQRKWSALIFDEGHRLRGRNSAWTKHVFRTRLGKAVNLDTPIWPLTGTPFVRDGGDFFPFFHLYDKKTYGSYWRFVNDRCVVVETPWSKNVKNIRKAYAEEFRRELAQFSLRRTVGEIPQLADLEFVENNYRVDLPKSVIKMMQKAKKSYVLEHEDLARPEFLKGAGPLYVQLRKIATVPPTVANPKLEWLKDFLQDKKGKVVVYTWYKDSAHTVADALGDKAVLITGSVTPQRRDPIISKWRDPSGPQIIVATIPSLSTGISLTESQDVVFLEHSELPSDQEQCIKRLCRRGQASVVQVHHVRANKSIDVTIERLLNSREEGSTSALQKWLEEDDTEGDWFT